MARNIFEVIKSISRISKFTKFA